MLHTPSPIRLEGLHDTLERERVKWLGKPKVKYNEFFDMENKIPSIEFVENVKQTITNIIKETAPQTIQMVVTRDINLDKEEDVGWNIKEISKLRETLETIIRESPGQAIGIVTHGNTAKLLMFLLEHPNEEIPTLKELKIEYPIYRGECWKASVNSEMKLLEAPRLFSERKRSWHEKELATTGKEKEQK